MVERDLSDLDEFVYIVRMVVKEVILRYVITWDYYLGYLPITPTISYSLITCSH